MLLGNVIGSPMRVFGGIEVKALNDQRQHADATRGYHAASRSAPTPMTELSHVDDFDLPRPGPAQHLLALHAIVAGGPLLEYGDDVVAGSSGKCGQIVLRLAVLILGRNPAVLFAARRFARGKFIVMRFLPSSVCGRGSCIDGT